MPFYHINCTDLRRSILRLKAKFHFRDRSATSNFAPLHAKMSKLVNFRFGFLKHLAPQLGKVFVYIGRNTQRGPERRHIASRSEEHTSELQSLMRISYAVLCLKKKSSMTVRASLRYNKS